MTTLVRGPNRDGVVLPNTNKKCFVKGLDYGCNGLWADPLGSLS